MPGKRLHPQSDEDRQRIGRALCAARTAKDMTLVQVAGLLGYTPAYINHIELGRKRLTPDLAARFAEVYGCTAETFERVAA